MAAVERLATVRCDLLRLHPRLTVHARPVVDLILFGLGAHGALVETAAQLAPVLVAERLELLAGLGGEFALDIGLALLEAGVRAVDVQLDFDFALLIDQLADTRAQCVLLAFDGAESSVVAFSATSRREVVEVAANAAFR